MQISKAFVTYGIRRWGTRLQSALPSNCGRRATLTAMRRASSFVSATKWSPVECHASGGTFGLTSRERPQKPAPACAWRRISDAGHGAGELRSRMPGMGLGSNKRRFRKSSACIAPCS
jgi:hypothetical protein